MATIWNPAVRLELVRRAESLTPAHAAKWGRFSVAAMVAHLNDATLMALDELPVSAKAPPFLRLAPVRYLLIHVLPMPRSAPTAPELLARSGSAELAGELAAFRALMDRLGAATTLAARHPAFGPMTRDDWGVLAHKHTDHHLRQFGV
ncbi:MAG: DUF1569 domain-containing protein [Vicinamibacterales bacterium]